MVISTSEAELLLAQLGLKEEAELLLSQLVLKEEDEPDEERNALLTPFLLGSFALAHRVVMAPISSSMSSGSTTRAEQASLYYSQRATPGGLIITEATGVADDSTGYRDTPGIWTEEQVKAWKPIVKAVHDKGAYFFLQLWHCGRASHVDFQSEGHKPVSSTNKRIRTGPTGQYSEPRALDASEISTYVRYFRQAARNAMEAGFDGVEVHVAYGYLIDQFLKDGVNHRADRYGGSIQRRARFALEIVDAVVEEVGAGRVGILLSPFTDFLDCSASDPSTMGIYLAQELNDRGVLYSQWPELGVFDILTEWDAEAVVDLAGFRKVFKGAFLVTGGHTRASGIRAVESGAADAIVYIADIIS